MSLLAEALYQLEERAGIMEFDGGSPRAEAEADAIRELERDPAFGDGVKRQAIRTFRERLRAREVAR